MWHEARVLRRIPARQAWAFAARVLIIALVLAGIGFASDLPATVVKVENGILTVETEKGNMDLRLQDSTPITKHRQKASINELIPGTVVLLDVSKGKTAVRSIKVIQAPIAAGRPTPDEPPDPRLDPVRRQIVEKLAGDARQYDYIPTELGRLKLYFNVYGPYRAKRDDGLMTNAARTHELVAKRIRQAFGVECPDDPIEMVWMYLRAVQKKLSPLADEVWAESQVYAYVYAYVGSNAALWLYGGIPAEAKAKWGSMDLFARTQMVQQAMMIFLDDAIRTRDAWGESEDQIRGLLGAGGYYGIDPQFRGSMGSRELMVKALLSPSGESRFKQADVQGQRRLFHATLLLRSGLSCDLASGEPGLSR